MTHKKWLIVGEDQRLKELAKLLSRPERTVYYKKTKQWDSQLNALVLDFEPDYIVLPIQPLSFEAEQLHSISRETVIFVGRLDETWKEILKNHTVIRYLEHEGFIWKNARLTAEGFIAAFYERESRVITDRRFVISGFGRISKMLASLLTQLGAQVCIVARSVVQVSEARAYGYEATFLHDYEHSAKDEYFINTIPAQWLSEEQARKLPNVIYDLASAPGCLEMDASLIDKYELLPALPGKYFAQDAALVLWQTIEEESTKCYKEKE